MSRHRQRWKDPVSPEALSRLACFARLDDETLDAVVEAAEGVRCAPGCVIVTHGDPDGDVYFILEGSVRVETFTPRGRRITYDMLDEGMMFGELSAIDGKRRSATCTAETEVHLARMPAGRYNAIMRQIPALADASLERLASLVRHLLDKVYEFHALPVAQRVRRRLLEIAETAGGSENTLCLSPGPTDDDIASRAGTTREAVNREVAALAKAGLVRRKKKPRSLEFLDIDGLRALVRKLDR